MIVEYIWLYWFKLLLALRYAKSRINKGGWELRKEHKGPNRNFVGLDEIGPKKGLKAYIYSFRALFGLFLADGRAGPGKCLLLNGGRGTVLRMMLEIYNQCFF